MHDPVVPIIHSNGSSAHELLTHLRAVYVQIGKALEALRHAAPHHRDYYVSEDPHLFEKARAQYTTRLHTLEQLRLHLLKECQGIQRQVKPEHQLGLWKKPE